jgi:hypothetical protein
VHHLSTCLIVKNFAFGNVAVFIVTSNPAYLIVFTSVGIAFPIEQSTATGGLQNGQRPDTWYRWIFKSS